MNLIAAQVQTANPILILIFIPLVNYLIYPAIDKVFPLTPLRKIGIGLLITALSFRDRYDPRVDRCRTEAEYQLATPRLLILTLGEAMVSITGLEFSYTQAPNFDEEFGDGVVASKRRERELFVLLVNWIILRAAVGTN